MTTDSGAPPAADPPEVALALPARGAAKQPQQLATLLENTLRQEFPEAAALIEVACLPDQATVVVRNLDRIDPPTARKLARRARLVYNEFLISPWY